MRVTALPVGLAEVLNRWIVLGDQGAREGMQQSSRALRTALYVPGANSRAIVKARTLDCDAIIFDLEDAVAPQEKDLARDNVAAALRMGAYKANTLLVRLNGLETPWGREDLKAIPRMAGIDGIVVPKVATRSDLAEYAHVAKHSSLGLWPMIETCVSLFNLLEISQAPGVNGLILGLNDLGTEMGIKAGPDRTPFHTAMFLTVAAARSAGIAVIDGVFNSIEDTEGLIAEAKQARAFGFDGKTLIHPAQITPCATAFMLTAEERATAEEIVAAFEAGSGGVVRVEGRMVEEMHANEARRALRLPSGRSASLSRPETDG
jgi:citrate lyase beta subunit